MDAGTLQFLVGQAPTATLALIFLWAFVTGKIHSDPEFQRMAADRDTERKAKETEREAHEKTRQAYELAAARGDAGVRAAELIAASLEGARRAAPQVQAPSGGQGDLGQITR